MSGLAILILASSVAVAPIDSFDKGDSPSGLDAAFRNTIVSTFPDGRQAKLWLNEDGSYRSEGRRHRPSSGHWKIKGDDICMKQSEPIAIPFNYCTPLQSGGVGTSWQAKSATGETVLVTLVEGR